MRVRLFAVLLGLVFAGAAAAAPAPAVPAPFVEGTDYFLINPPQRSGVDGKIEVTEAFSYGCPACNFAYPNLEKIRKNPVQRRDDYVPASFKPNEDWPMFQRAYSRRRRSGSRTRRTGDVRRDLEGQDAGDHESRRPHDQESAADDRGCGQPYAKFGVKAEDFVATANSFAISTKMKQADAYIRAHWRRRHANDHRRRKYRLNYQSAGGDWDKMGR
jgi:thiol:disulfide interchange protein DsbA